MRTAITPVLPGQARFLNSGVQFGYPNQTHEIKEAAESAASFGIKL
jgi:hypothetical protein